MTAGFLLAHALGPAFCEEAIRSSYIYYFAERGRRRMTVITLMGVFVVGEAIYDYSLLSRARLEFGSPTSEILFIVALSTGTLIHMGLTQWTANRLRAGSNALRIFLSALLIHGVFNLIAISGMGLMI